VDMYKTFCDYVSDGNKQYGGYLSIQLSVGVRPILMVGQDESLVPPIHLFKKAMERSKWQSIPNA
jgi:hypothetical protein